MKLHVIGCYAATPRAMTRPSAQILEVGAHLFLIDCGEGTQMELRRLKIRFSRIQHIFISHLHGDHFFGLPGLVATFRLLGRENPLHIYGPKGLQEAVTLLLKLGDSWTQYPLHFHELTSSEPELIMESDSIEVSTLPLDHRIYTNGFLFREKPGQRRLKADVAQSFGIDKAYYRKIKQGADGMAADGRSIPNSVLTEPPPPAKSYAYCSDTSYKEALVPLVHRVNTLYHESTFLNAESDLAARTGHSTARQAAMIAREAGVERLLLGHYSTRYKDLEVFKEEAASVFPNTELSEDGKTFTW